MSVPAASKDFTQQVQLAKNLASATIAYGQYAQKKGYLPTNKAVFDGRTKYKRLNRAVLRARRGFGKAYRRTYAFGKKAAPYVSAFYAGEKARQAGWTAKTITGSRAALWRRGALTAAEDAWEWGAPFVEAGLEYAPLLAL